MAKVVEFQNNQGICQWVSLNFVSTFTNVYQKKRFFFLFSGTLKLVETYDILTEKKSYYCIDQNMNELFIHKSTTMGQKQGGLKLT